MKNDKGLKFAYEDADKHNWSKAELEAYDYVLMREQDDRGRLTFAIKKELKQVARDLIKTNLPTETIANITKLSIEQIEKLRAENY